MKKIIAILTLCILTSLFAVSPATAATITNCPKNNTNNVKISSNLESLLAQAKKACKKNLKVIKIKKCKKSSTNFNSNAANSTKTNTTPKATTNTKPATTTTNSTPSGNYREFQKRVIDLVNKERAAAGLKALSENTQLDKVATLKSEDMAKLGYFSHTSPTYGSPFDMLKQFGISYTAAGENIAYGQSTPEEVMNGWMNSPGHRANILNANYTQIGVGIAKKPNGQLVWTQTFTRP
jgi:uncharacterized YkwD family protein